MIGTFAAARLDRAATRANANAAAITNVTTTSTPVAKAVGTRDAAAARGQASRRPDASVALRV